MRRALRPLFPGWSELFGLKPWEVCGGPQELTFGEIAEYQRHVKRRNAEMEKAADDARKGR